MCLTDYEQERHLIHYGGTVQKLKMSTMQTLKDSELCYRLLFEAAQDGILILEAK